MKHRDFEDQIKWSVLKACIKSSPCCFQLLVVKVTQTVLQKECFLDYEANLSIEVIFELEDVTAFNWVLSKLELCGGLSALHSTEQFGATAG